MDPRQRSMRLLSRVAPAFLTALTIVVTFQTLAFADPSASAAPSPGATTKPTCPDVPVFTSRDGKTYVAEFSDQNAYSGTVNMTIYAASATYGANVPIAIALPARSGGYRSLPFTIANPSSDPFEAVELTFNDVQVAGGCVVHLPIGKYSDTDIDANAAFAALDPARPPVPLLKVVGESSALTCKTPYATARIDGEPAMPVYPDMARELGQTGTTLVKVTLAPTGAVTDLSIYSSSGSSILDRSALNSAAATRYHPPMFRCEPISGSFIYKVLFGVAR